MSFDARFAVTGKHKGYNYESITVTDAPIGFTASILLTSPPPKRALITAETAQLRYRYDGTDPASDEGHPLNPMDVLVLEGVKNLKNFKAIRTGDTSAVLKVTFER